MQYCSLSMVHFIYKWEDFVFVIIKLDLESELYQKIDELVRDGKYSDLYQFIKIAINNQLQEEKTGVSKGIETDVSQPISTSTKKLLREIYRELSDIPLEKSELPVMPQPLIWSFYNRFFPVKIVVRHLASLVSESKKWIKLNEVQDQAFDYAERISERLKEYEDEHNISRNEKLSTGLPLPRSELKGLRGYKKKNKEDKLVASKIRFQDQFVGHYIKKDSVFKGACFEMGLVGVKIDNDECLLSLTEIGREFALLENPILEQDKLTQAFSDEEAKFILEKVIPKFSLENIIVKRILNELQNKSLTANEIDDIFTEEKKKYYASSKLLEESKKKLFNSTTSERVATMGRLSELRAVNWKIDSGGRSVYSIV